MDVKAIRRLVGKPPLHKHDFKLYLNGDDLIRSIRERYPPEIKLGAQADKLPK
jgi:hypothetical protein